MQPEIKKMLDYQKIEEELVKIEKILESNPNRVTIIRMANVVKDSQKLAEQLEKDAQKTVNDYEEVKKIYSTNFDRAQKFDKLDLDKLDEIQLNKVNGELEGILENLNSIEKQLVGLNKNVETILDKFDKAKRNAIIAKQNYYIAKGNFDKSADTYAGTKKRIEEQLSSIRHSVNTEIFSKYKSIRDGKVFPVLVPLANGLCGACRMQPPKLAIDKLTTKGFVECENCHRIIYQNQD